MRNAWLCWIGLIAIALFTACGGSSGGDGVDGGGGGGGGGGLPVFTPANAGVAAGEGVAALFTTSEIADFAEELFSGWYDLTFGAGRVAPLPVPGACDNEPAGTLDVEYTDADGSESMTVGDSVVFTFANCAMATDDGGSETFAGAITMTVTGIVGGPPPLPFTLNLAYSFGEGFSVTDGDDVTQVSGGFDYSLASNDNVNYTGTFSGSQLSYIETWDGGSYSAILTDFLSTILSNSNTGSYSINAQGSLNSSYLGMTVMYNTLVPFSGTDPDYPDTGTLVVVEDGGGTVTVDVNDNTTVDVILDADGDGKPEGSQTVPWTEIY